MKWGVRRSREVRGIKKAHKKRKAGIDRSDKKSIAKENARYKQELTKAKDKAANRLYSVNDSKLNKTINRMSTGEAIAQSFLLGSYGSLKYNEAKVVRKASEGSAIAQGLLAQMADTMFYKSISSGEYLANVLLRK
jgi:hypothetical protein